MKKRFYKMILVLFSVLFLLTAACSSSADNNERILEFSEERMMDVIEYLSSEDGSRIAGSEGEHAAAGYIADKFDNLGLDVSTQEFPMSSFTCSKVTLDVVGLELKHSVKVLSFSAATPSEGISAQIISVGMGADADYDNKDVTGKIVLIQRGGEYFRVKTERAHGEGAAAVIFYDPNGEDALAATLVTLSNIPAISISRKDAEVIDTAVGNGESVEAMMVVDSYVRNSTSLNVIAVHEAKKNPDDKFVVVGAHYDGVDTPAANDNATGVAVLLEMAAALKDNKIKLPFDVRFIAFGSEEIGLVGSAAYVAQMSRTDIRNILAMINYDMVGVGEEFVLLTVEDTDNNRLLESGKAVLRSIGYPPATDFTQRSDHASFSRAGIQAMDIQTYPAEFYHTDEDTIDKISPGLLTDACKLGMGLLMDEIPKW